MLKRFALWGLVCGTLATTVACHDGDRGDDAAESTHNGDSYSPPRTLTLAECRSEIASKVFIEPDSANRSSRIPDAERAAIILSVFDSLQPYQQKSFCTFDLILISEDVGVANTAYIRFDDSNQTFATLRFHPRAFEFDQRFSLEEYLTFQYQALFYPQDVRDTVYSDLPHLAPIDTKYSDHPILHSILVHEIGHIFEADNFPGSANDFAKISWSANRNPVGGFESRELFCNQVCMPYQSLPKEQAESIMDDLYDHEFISLYAAWSEEEDFAESMRHISLMEDSGIKLEWVLPSSGKTWDLNKKLQSPVFSIKYTLIKNAIAHPKYKHNFID